MTGDDAVVRVDHARAAIEAETLTFGDDVSRKLAVNVSVATLDNLARAYLAQAAEIERLTREVVEKDRQIKDVSDDRDQKAHLWRKSADRVTILLDEKQASEARTADLLKALERYGKHEWGCGHIITHRNADNLVSGFEKGKCTCGLDAAIAAKGGTV